MKEENKSTIHGVKWNAINSGVSQITTIITGIVLMRLLDPSAFGLIGMITVFTGFLNRLKDSGLGSSLIYQTDLTATDKDSVFWFSIFMGFIFFIVFFFSSSYIALYYDEPILGGLVKVFSLTFIFSSLSSVHNSLLKKQLAFKKIFIVGIIGLLSSTILAIIAAFMGLGVWSLIIMHLSSTLINTISIYILGNYKPSFNFSYSTLKSHFAYSFPVLGTKSFNYWTRNADNFFIGSMIGSQALGYYSRAYFFVTMPTQKISNIIGSILFPSLSLLKDNSKRAADLLLKSMRMTAFITFPLLGGLIVLAEPFVLSLFGKQWLPMVVALQVLCVLSLLESVFVFSTSIYFAKGATKLNFKISVLYGTANIIVFYIGSLHSIEMVAYLLLAVYIIFMFPKLYFAGRLIDIKVSDIFNSIKNIFFINLSCMLLSFGLFLLVLNKFESIISLIFGVLFYSLIFITFNLLLNKSEILTFINYAKSVIKEK